MPSSNQRLANDLRHLNRQHLLRAEALATELRMRAQTGINTLGLAASPERQEFLRDELEQIPRALTREAITLLKPHPELACHVKSLRRTEKDDNLQSVFGQVELVAQSLAIECEAPDDTPVETLVTLNQVAGLVQCEKRTLERHLQKKKLPPADFRGGNGRASKWKWSTIRPALEELFPRQIPERFPYERVI